MKYKLIGEDDHVFKVRHPDGSEFHIAKNAVGKEVHKRIKSLEPIKMAEGGEVPEDPSRSQLYDDDETQTVPPPPNVDLVGKPLVIEPAGTNEVPAQYAGPAGPSGPAPIQPPQSQQMQMNPPNSIPPGSPEFNMNQIMPTSLTPGQEAAFNQKELSLKNIGEAQEKGFQQQANTWQQLAKDQQALDAQTAKTMAPLEAKNQQLFQDIANNKVDHNRLFNNMSTGNKILAAISVALSGIGSGLTGKPNMAMEVIQKSIDRDIEDQKLDLGKKQSLFSENLRLLGDARSASLATKAQMLSAAQAKIQSFAAQSQSVQAKEQSQFMMKDVELQKEGLKREAAFRTMGMQGGNFDPAMLVPGLVPKERQAEVFKEIKDAQNIRTGSKEALDAFDSAQKEQSVFSKNVLPGVNSPYIGKIKAATLPQFQNIDGTVRQAAMDAFLPTVTPAVGDTSHTIDVKRKTLQDWLVAHSSAPTAKGYGINLDKFGSTTTQQPAQIVERHDPSTGKIALFNSDTKQFLGYK